jgi:hypothetical protein
MKGSARENRKNCSKALPRLPQRGEGGGEGTPSKSESTRDVEVDEEEEGEIIFPHSPLPENLPSPGDLFGQQMGPPLLPTG